MTALPLIRRRSLLGAAISAVVLPRLAFGQQGSDPTSQQPTDMTFSIAFNGQTMTATLYDNPSARDLYSMLPMQLTIGDFSTNEKIIYLPRPLTEEASGPFGNERPGDICYWAPWGNLALFYAGYTYSDGLIRLGRFDGALEPLLTKGDFPVSLD